MTLLVLLLTFYGMTLVRVALVYQRTGINPVKLQADDSVYEVTGRVLRKARNSPTLTAESATPFLRSGRRGRFGKRVLGRATSSHHGAAHADDEINGPVG